MHPYLACLVFLSSLTIFTKTQVILPGWKVQNSIYLCIKYVQPQIFVIINQLFMPRCVHMSPLWYKLKKYYRHKIITVVAKIIVGATENNTYICEVALQSAHNHIKNNR